MIFNQLFDEKSHTYTYIISSGKGREALIIDPVIEKTNEYLNILKNLELKLVKVIDTHIHADHVTGLNELNKKDLKLDMKIRCDAKYFLKKLFKKIKKYNSSNQWLDYCVNIRKKYPILIKKMINEKKYINSYFFVKTLSSLIKKHDSIITDMGFSFTTTHQALEVTGNQNFFTNSGHAPMGWGLPAAIGAFFSKKKSN